MRGWLSGVRRRRPPSSGKAGKAEHPRSLPGITVCGFLRAPIGVGEAARRTAVAVLATGIPASVRSQPLAVEPEVPFQGDASGPVHDTVILHHNPGPALDRLSRKLAGRRRIGVWYWELPVLPPRWAADAAKLDELWAPSRFMAEMLTAATSLPVRLVPHAAIYAPVDRDAARDALGLPRSRRIVLTAFDFRSYPTRKNPEGVLRAFADAFPAGRDAPLLVVKYHRGDREEDAATIARIAAVPHVRVIDRSVGHDEMRLTYGAADAFISLHRSEGFGFNIFDMMALGRVCIATDFSGNVDFMNAGNSIPIPWTMRAVGRDEYPNGHGQWWAEPDHDAAVAALRFVGTASDTEIAALGARARTDTLRDFSVERVAGIIRDAWAAGATGSTGSGNPPDSKRIRPA